MATSTQEDLDTCNAKLKSCEDDYEEGTKTQEETVKREIQAALLEQKKVLEEERSAAIHKTEAAAMETTALLSNCTQNIMTLQDEMETLRVFEDANVSLNTQMTRLERATGAEVTRAKEEAAAAKKEAAAAKEEAAAAKKEAAAAKKEATAAKEDYDKKIKILENKYSETRARDLEAWSDDDTLDVDVKDILAEARSLATKARDQSEKVTRKNEKLTKLVSHLFEEGIQLRKMQDDFLHDMIFGKRV